MILSTERLVSTDFIRKHSFLVKIPGYLVKSVSVVPLGAHPMGMFNLGMNESQSYSSDIDFINDHYEATREPAALGAWLEEWVFGCPNRDDYMNKLGYDRIASLKKSETLEGLQEQRLNSLLGKISTSLEYNPVEMMIVAAARKTEEIVHRHDYKVILCGMGVSGLTSWLAYHQLRDKNCDVQLVLGNSLYGPVPSPGDPFLSSVRFTQSCKMMRDSLTGYPLIVCGKSRRSLSILGAAQIDKHGNLNSGKLSEKVYLQGPGGAGDACQASEVLAILRQSKDRFLEKLPYITSAGNQVTTLVSEFGVFEKIEDADEFTLVACLPTPGASGLAEKIRRTKDNCGWELKVSPKVKELAPPSFNELMTIRLFDPDGYYRH